MHARWLTYAPGSCLCALKSPCIYLLDNSETRAIKLKHAVEPAFQIPNCRTKIYRRCHRYNEKPRPLSVGQPNGRILYQHQRPPTRDTEKQEHSTYAYSDTYNHAKYKMHQRPRTCFMAPPAPSTAISKCWSLDVGCKTSIVIEVSALKFVFKEQ